MELGQIVRILRGAAGWSIAELAARSGLSTSYVGRLERGRASPPRDDRLRAIAEALGIPAAYLAALSSQVSAEATDYLRAMPEVEEFILAARDAGLGPHAFRRLHDALRALGARAFQAAIGDLPRGAGAAAGVRPWEGGVASRLAPELVWCDTHVRTREALLRHMTRGIARLSPEIDPETCLARLLEREAESSTGVGCGVALPHVPVPGLEQEIVAIATSREGIEWEAIDAAPARIIFLVLGSARDGAWRLGMLARIARIFSQPEARARLVEARGGGELLERLRELDARIP